MELTDNTHEKRIKVLRCASNCAMTALSPFYNAKRWKHAGLEPYDPSRILLSGLVKHSSLPKIEQEEPSKKRKRAKFESQIVSNDFFPFSGMVKSSFWYNNDKKVSD